MASQVNVEQRTETLLKVGIAAQLATDSVTDVTHRRFWSSDTGDSNEDAVDKTINYVADPNVPKNGGYLSPYRVVPVMLTIMTSEAKDPKRVTLALIYDSVRKAIDFNASSFTDTDMNPVEVQLQPGGTSSIVETEFGSVNQVELPIQVDINYPGS